MDSNIGNAFSVADLQSGAVASGKSANVEGGAAVYLPGWNIGFTVPCAPRYVLHAECFSDESHAGRCEWTDTRTSP